MADAARRRRDRPLAGNARARENELTRTFSPPLHYVVEIEPVSELLKLEEYEFGVFEAGGYRWSLTLYTRRYEGRDGKKYMSLRLSMEEPNKLRDHEEVFVKCRFFVFDYNRRDYVIFEEKGKELRAYSKANHERKSIKLLSLKSFQDPRCQYRDGNRCKFGAEVLVSRRERKKETVTFIRGHRAPEKITTKIQQFSSSEKSSQYSDSFQFEGRKWKLKVYPQRTDGGRGRKMLCVCLKPESISEGKKIYVKAKLRMLNREPSNNKEKTVSGWVSAEENKCRREDFMAWSNLEKPNGGGFVRGRALSFEVEILVISRVERKDERLR